MFHRMSRFHAAAAMGAGAAWKVSAMHHSPMLTMQRPVMLPEVQMNEPPTMQTPKLKVPLPQRKFGPFQW